MRRIEIKFNRKPYQTATFGLGLALLLLTLPLVGGALFGSEHFGTRLHASVEPSPAVARLTPAVLAPTQRLTTSDQTPQGLAPSDWASIRAAYEQGRHRAFPVAGGHQARNPGQQWRTHFDGRGFAVEPEAGAWRWGLELRGYGFESQTRDLTGQARVTTAGARVTYTWDETVEEWFVNDARGLEHGFTLKQPPASGAGARVELRLGVRGGLRPQVQAGGRGVSFVNAAGGAVPEHHAAARTCKKSLPAITAFQRASC